MTSTCPTCGNPHDSWNGVARHMIQMSDEEHPNVGTVNEAIEHMVRIGHIDPGEPETDDVDDGDQDVDELEAAATDGGNPALEGPEGKAAPPTSDDGELVQELPCGHEEVDLGSDEAQALLEEHGAVRATCDDCGGTWNVEP